MGMFNNLMTKIFHHAAVAEAPADAYVAPASGTAAAANAGTVGGGPALAGSAPSTPATAVDVEAILNKLAAGNDQKLDWKHSIVDLMKLVGMDSGIAARKELAADLKYTGNTDDSAAMNMWLHKEVMKKLAENGGKVPAELLT